MLKAIFGLFYNAVGIMFLGCVGSILLFYGLGFLIGAFIRIVVWLALLLMNPMLYVFIIALIIGGFLLLNR
ncbi:MAG: hypothetical protein CVV29_06550 [Methanobacteriales archaeon HGW-Methanobacteriales-2]|nr:MAG: hypothetical protein CVV29_06550 [Methanobacteriales archaeon HGW-Methanobacteriales-2]